MLNLKYSLGRIALVVTLIVFSFTSCSIKYTFTGASISPDVKTVSIDYYQNYAPLVNPNLSSTFTEALKDRFITQTGLTLVKEYGDLQFSGQITGYAVSPIAIQGNETAAQNRLTITVKVKFVNAKDEKQNFEKSFSQFSDFPGDKDFSSIESEQVKIIVDKLIDEIFNSSIANW